MMRWTPLLLLAGCSAPDVAPTAPTPPDPFAEQRPPASQPEVPAADRAPTEEDIAAAVTEPPPTEEDLAAADNTSPPPTGPVELPAASTAELPPPKPPYTGWTLAAPLQLQGPGGATLTTLERVGVRVEVVGERSGRLNVQCSGCTETWKDAGGWVDVGVVIPAGRPAPADSPLAPALSLRAGWARGEGLPEGAEKGSLCRLVDLGFTPGDGQATWSGDGGLLVVSQSDGVWEVTDLTAPTQSTGRCRVTRSDDTGQGEVAPR